MKLDKKDKRILALFYENSRMSFTEMGKKLKLSSSSVERRVRQLRDSGVISRVFANINYAKIGFKSYRLYFKFDTMDKKTEAEILKMFEEYPRTAWGVICEGEFDVLWRTIERDEMDVEKMAYMMQERFGSRITEKNVAIAIYNSFLPWNLVSETERKISAPAKKSVIPEQLDNTDMKLLAALSQNARESTVDLSKIVGLSPDAVKYRMKRLVEKGFILGYTAWFDAKKLGFNQYKIFIGFRNATKEDESRFFNYCIGSDRAIFISKNIGSWDMDVDIIVRDNSELHEFMQEMKMKFGHILGRHTFISELDHRLPNPLREYLRP